MNPILAGIIGAAVMWYLLALLSFPLDADDILLFPLVALVYVIAIPALPFYWLWRMLRHVFQPVVRERFERCQFKHVWHITNNLKCVRESHLTWKFWKWFFFVRIKKGA